MSTTVTSPPGTTFSQAGCTRPAVLQKNGKNSPPGIIVLPSHLFPEFEGRLATPGILPEHLKWSHHKIPLPEAAHSHPCMELFIYRLPSRTSIFGLAVTVLLGGASRRRTNHLRDEARRALQRYIMRKLGHKSCNGLVVARGARFSGL